ncbi:MAG: DMT family transporter [Victivallaceae bacterium]|nr:DMT family transporter [Victivallaceae bacterium]
MFFEIAHWWFLIVASALGLGFYDICKKAAVRENSVMPVLFLATLCGTVFYLGMTAATGSLATAFICDGRTFFLLLLKALLVAASWICVYYAIRELPISIASPIRSSAPLWTVCGAIVLYGETPTKLQLGAMILIFAGYYLFSVLGKLENISFVRSKGIHLVIVGTLLGAASALYDKYLLGVLQIPRTTLQLYFSLDLTVILLTVCLIRGKFFGQHHAFQWRWSIPATGVLLILADYLYFAALQEPGAQISILSLVRRSGCIVTFAAGAAIFHEKNVWKKSVALLLILLGVLLLAIKH